MDIKTVSEQPEADNTFKSFVSMVDTPPEEAAQNISRANIFEISPDSYKDLKEHLEPEAKSFERIPAQVGQATKEYIGDSEQKAALVGDDLKNLNWFEKRIKYNKQQVFDIPELNRRANELSLKEIMDGKLNPNDEEELNDTNAAISDIQKSSEDIPGIGEKEKFITEVAVATGDFIRSYTENLEIIGTGVGGGAALGAAAGSFVPGIGTAGGATAGAVQGFVAASTVVGFLDAFKQTTGSVNNELRQSDVPTDRRHKVSIGVGVLSGIAGGVAGKIISSANPFMKRFASPKLAAQLLTGNAAMMAKMEVLGGIGKSIVAEGGEEALQQLTEILGKTFGKMDESEASFQNALDTSIELAKTTFKPETIKEVIKAATVGGATGGVISTTTSLPGYAGLKKRYEETQVVAKKREEVLRTQNTLLEAANDIKETKINKFAPQEMNAFTKKVFETLGIDDNVYFSLESAREFANTPEKGAAFRKAIDPEGELTRMAQELGTTIPVAKADLMNIVTEFPEITDHMRLTPDGETPNEARTKSKDLVERISLAEAKREELLSTLGTDEPLDTVGNKEIQEAFNKKIEETSKLSKEDKKIDRGGLFAVETSDFFDNSEGYSLNVETNGEGNYKVNVLDSEGNLINSRIINTKSKTISPVKYSNPEMQKKYSKHLSKKSVAETIASATDVISTGLMVDTDFDEKNQNQKFKPIPEQSIKAQLEELSRATEDDTVYKNKVDFIESQAFDEIPGIMTKEEAEVWNTKLLDAKLSAAEALTQDIEDNFKQIENRIFKDVDAKDIKNEIAKLDREFKILENFENKEVTALTVEHKKKGYSVSAIDPKSLPEDLKEIYYYNDKLHERKVFVEGGLTLEESAIYNDVESGEELLRILAETPSRKEVKTLREQREIELRNRIQQTIKPAKMNARDAAFSNVTKVKLEIMNYMKNKEWSTVKRGIIKIASRVPTISELNDQAKIAISKMKIKDLKPSQFVKGEKDTQKAALKNFLNSEFEQAFDNYRKSALNNEFRKEAINASERVAKAERFWKKVESPEVQQELKDAGYDKAMDEFRSIYNLTGKVKGEAEINSFQKFLKAQVEAGEYVPFIPERLNVTQISSKHLTVEQYQAITEMGEFLVHKAKLKNKLLAKAEAREELRTAEMIAEEIDTTAKQHMNFDPEKAKSTDERYTGFTATLKNKIRTGMSMFRSIKNLTFELDEYKTGGIFDKYIGQPLKKARTNLRQELLEIVTQDKKIIETFYGEQKFKDMFNEFINVPEFKGIASLGDGEGNIRKVDLLTLQAYMGDPEGRKSMENFVDAKNNRFSADQMKLVLERELDSNDAAFVQNFLVNRFKRFEERSFDLHKRTTGVEPELVKGVEVEHKGKILPGGYYPIKRKMISDDLRAAKMLEEIESKELGNEEGSFFAKMRSAESTQQGRLKERSGSDRPLDITFENFIEFTNEFAHDLHFREPGIDVLKVLKNPLNVKNMKSIIGTTNFVTLLNSVKDSISKTSERESVLFSEQYQWINKTIQTAHSLHAVKTIGINLASAAIQPASLSNLSLRLGSKVNLYLLKHFTKMGTNLLHFGKYEEQAMLINPDLKFEKDGIDSAVIKDDYDFIPASNTFFEKWKTGSGQTIAKFRDLQKKMINNSFALVREVDRGIKIGTTLAVSEMFLNGDIEGYSYDKVQSMSESERAKTMQSVVQQAIDLTLTASSPEDKSSFEKMKIAAIFGRYFVDRRNRLDTTLSEFDKIRGAVKKGDYRSAAAKTLHLSLVAGSTAALINMVRGKDDEDEDTPLDTLWNFASAPANSLLEDIPGLDIINYQVGLELKTDYRNASAPIFGVASDISMGAIALKDSLKMARKAVGKKLGIKVKGAPVELSDIQKKALLTSAGYLVGGAPTNGMYKAIETLDSKEVKSGAKFLKTEFEELHQEINKFIDTFKDNKEAQPFINDLKEYQKTLPQTETSIENIIPENSKEVIKSALSEGKWNKVDPLTGAAGIYQFTEERWKEIMLLNPDLGLTENGRVTKDSSQQEKAMEWVNQDNTRALMAYEIPVNVKNLLGAHKFGFENYTTIYSAKDTDKLSKVLGEESKKPIFSNFKTVKDIKDYLNSNTN